MKNRIRVARTANLQNVTGENLNIVLAEGQPFYDAQTKLFYIGDGVSTIASIKADSTKAITASNVKDTINNKSISSIFESNGTTVKNSTNSKNLNDASGTIANGVTATTQDKVDNSDKVATTKFVHDIVGFKQDNLIYNSKVVGKIFKCCGFVFGYIKRLGVPYTTSECYITIENASEYEGFGLDYRGDPSHPVGYGLDLILLDNGDEFSFPFELTKNPSTNELSLHLTFGHGLGFYNDYNGVDMLTFCYTQE